MYLVVVSREDPASMNIRERLVEMVPWSEEEGMLRHGSFLIHEIEDMHLHHDNPEITLGHEIEAVIFASRHKSVSGLRSLTVHPMGNYAGAEFGGMPGTLVPSAPHLMTAALRLLRIHASRLPYQVSFEVTHHGPYLRTPSFFIEIGSSEEYWGDPRAAGAIARTILGLEGAVDRDAPIAIGIGGGHYAPRHTELALSKRVAMGHMVPNYALESEAERHVEMAKDCTPGASVAYIHRKAVSRQQCRVLAAHAESLGLRVVSSRDLEEG
ncbi:MAG: D-aminoacyl-tRNA deacylase [Candidatus Thermoplasmatota archaeon]